MNINWSSIAAIAFFFLSIVITFKVYFTENPKRNFNPVRFIARVGIFGAMSTILYVVEIFTIKLPFFPSFLSLHFDEIPAFIAGFAYGPWAGLAVVAIRTIIKLPFTSTLCVGELADFLLSAIYILTASFIYKKMRNLKGVAIAFGISTVAQIIAGMVLNVYVLIPFYEYLYHMSDASLLFVMRLANPAISNVGWSYALLAVLPFNAMKDGIVIVLTFLVYRSIHKLLRFEH